MNGSSAKREPAPVRTKTLPTRSRPSSAAGSSKPTTKKTAAKKKPGVKPKTQDANRDSGDHGASDVNSARTPVPPSPPGLVEDDVSREEELKAAAAAQHVVSVLGGKSRLLDSPVMAAASVPSGVTRLNVSSPALASRPETPKSSSSTFKSLSDESVARDMLTKAVLGSPTADRTNGAASVPPKPDPAPKVPRRGRPVQKQSAGMRAVSAGAPKRGVVRATKGGAPAAVEAGAPVYRPLRLGVTMVKDANAKILNVAAGGLGESAGLQPNDVIVEINTISIGTGDQVANIMQVLEIERAETVEVVVLRDGKRLNLSAPTGNSTVIRPRSMTTSFVPTSAVVSAKATDAHAYMYNSRTDDNAPVPASSSPQKTSKQKRRRSVVNGAASASSKGSKSTTSAPKSVPTATKPRTEAKRPTGTASSATSSRPTSAKKTKPKSTPSSPVVQPTSVSDNKNLQLLRLGTIRQAPQPQPVKKKKPVTRTQSKVPAYLRKKKFFKPEPRVERLQRLRVRKRIVEELVKTENDYVQHLETVKAVYMRPLIEMAGTGDEIIPRADLTVIFMNVEVILGLNTKLLEDMRTRTKKWRNKETLIGDIFVEFAPFFKMYTTYINNHERATARIAQFAKNKKFKKFAEAARADERTGGKSLDSYLIMPVQRVPRYKLLLDQLLKYTQKDHPDYRNIRDAIQYVESTASAINEQARAHANREEIVGICHSFSTDPGFVSPSRFFIRQGPLTKVGTKTNDVYEFFLFNDLFAYASKASISSKFTLHGKFNINKSFSVEDIPDVELSEQDHEEEAVDVESTHTPRATPTGAPLQYAFKILSQQKSFIVFASDENTKKLWLDEIGACLEERKDRIDALQSEAKLEQPVMAQIDVPKCQRCEAQFGIFKRRHHCSKCGFVVCASCASRKLIVRGKGEEPVRVCDHCMNDIRSEYAAVADAST